MTALNPTDCLLGIFAKYWGPGEAKTRLAADIGADRAAALAQTFLAVSLDRLSKLKVARQLAYTPAHRREEFADLANSQWTLVVQPEGDLGQRMQWFFESAFQQQFKRVVLIGSDTPHLPMHIVESAFELLAEHQAVIGPSNDGGYYLMGLSREVPSIFNGMVWSHHSVFDITTRRLRACRVPFATLPPWYDIDDVRQLAQLQRDLKESTDADMQSLGERINRTMGTVRGDG